MRFLAAVVGVLLGLVGSIGIDLNNLVVDRDSDAIRLISLDEYPKFIKKLFGDVVFLEWGATDAPEAAGLDLVRVPPFLAALCSAGAEWTFLLGMTTIMVSVFTSPSSAAAFCLVLPVRIVRVRRHGHCRAVMVSKTLLREEVEGRGARAGGSGQALTSAGSRLAQVDVPQRLRRNAQQASRGVVHSKGYCDALGFGLAGAVG